MPERPNIVLICVDQWRGDCLSIDRHPVVHTPYLDQLALNGVRFSQAYSAVPSCIAARAGLLTGLSPRSHGRVGYKDGVPWNYETTLAGEFTRHGYQTQAVGKMHVYPERSQLGFQNVQLHDGYLHFARDRRRDMGMIDDYLPWLNQQLGREADYFEHGVNCNSIVARPWDKDEYLHPTNWVTSQSVEFLRRRDPRKPFMLFMSYHRPHPPYDPPAWAFEMYRDMPMPPPPVGDWAEDYAAYHNPDQPDGMGGQIDPRWLQRARAGYYGHMTHIDHQLNRFWEALQEYHLHDNTWILFTADHGELMGDHHLFRKIVPYDGSTRVPFILVPPRGSNLLPKGAKLDDVLELRDVMPTLLEAAGLPIPECVEGQSALPLARGESGAGARYIHGEHSMWGPLGTPHWITDGREKYVWFSATGQEQLFDLVNDPQELHDLMRTPEGETRAQRWRQALITELTGREEGFADGEKLIPGRPITPVLSHVLRED